MYFWRYTHAAVGSECHSKCKLKKKPLFIVADGIWIFKAFMYQWCFRDKNVQLRKNVIRELLLMDFFGITTIFFLKLLIQMRKTMWFDFAA